MSILPPGNGPLPPATGPITLSELSARLERAAQIEIFAINQVEWVAGGDAVLGEAVAGIRRQAMALAMAAKISEALRARPDLALGLGIAALALPEGGPES